MKHLIVFLSLIFVGSATASAKMVYLHQTDDTRRVALATDGGEFVRFITPKDQDAYHPELSADGRYVAYSMGTIAPGEKVNVAVYVEELATGRVEQWTPKGNQYIHAEFSGNGRYLAFSGPVQKSPQITRQNIHIVNLEKERQKGWDQRTRMGDKKVFFYRPDYEIIKSQWGCFFPALSSDGRFVVYHRTRDTSSKQEHKELVRYKRRQNTKKRISPEGKHAMVPSLSADNQRVAYVSHENSQWDIHLLNLESLESTRLTNSQQREFTPVFAPDGSITYTRFTNKEGQNVDLDLYRISARMVEQKAPVEAKPLVAQSGILEYIPSFSGDTSFELKRQPELLKARSSFGAVHHQGRIFVAGGHQGRAHTYPPESFLDRLDIYNTETNTWSQAASMSRARQGFELVAYKHYIYAFGGFTYSTQHNPPWKSMDIIERYNTKTNKWKVLSTRLPRRRSSNVAVRMGHKVYLIGGWDSTPQHHGDKKGKFHRKIDVFNLKTETITVADTTLPKPRRRAFTAVSHKGRIFLLGGITQGSNFSWLDNVTAFNPETGQWSEMKPLPFPTFAPGAGVSNNRLFLFGGMIPSLQYVNTVYSLKLGTSSNRWINTGRYLAENKGFPIVTDLKGQALGILGGHSYKKRDNGELKDSPVATFEKLVPALSGQ